MIALSARELSAVLAGLRILQDQIDNNANSEPNDQAFQGIWNNLGMCTGLSAAEIDYLCEEINQAGLAFQFTQTTN